VVRFKGRVFVVTGGGAGIGWATAKAAVDEGAAVGVLDVQSDSLDQARKSLPADKCLAVKCDVSNGREVAAAFAEVKNRCGGVDVLVNNAGIQHYGTVVDTPEDEWDRVMGINLKGAYLCAQQAIPMMQARGRGVVVNLSSVQAFLSQPAVAPYTTSKTALLGLTRSIAVDYSPTVRCVAVCPGTVDTPMLRWAIQQSPDPEAVLEECRQMHPVKRIATPEEVASLILYLASDEAAFITGQYFRIDGGLGLAIGGGKKQ
jgi:NAD(P)-dependent dehydrogenase (short-subunit alcohol dehydrogenase family)